MFVTVIRRLLGNRWKAISLSVGLILAVAVAFSIPVYTDAILQRILVKTLEDTQNETGVYPGYISLELRLQGQEKSTSGILNAIDGVMSRTTEDYIKIPQVSGSKILRFELFKRQIDPVKDTYVRPILYNIEGLEDHVRVTLGRMYDPTRDDGVIEVVVDKKYLVKNPLVMNEVYEFDSMFSGEESIRIEIVGMVECIDPSDVFWYVKYDKYTSSMFAPNEYILKRMSEDPAFTRHFTGGTWFQALDYHSFDQALMQEYIDGYEAEKTDMKNTLGIDRLSFGCLETLREYDVKSTQVMVSLFILIIPIFILLAFYIVMVARLKMDSEQNEISVLQSRGAGRRHILRMYLIESLLLMGIAVILGPLLGFFLCRIIGASNGFLEFVNRKALALRVQPVAIYTVAATAVLFLIIIMIPAFTGAGINIVESKKRRLRKRQPFYHRYFLDVFALAFSLYNYYTMTLSDAAKAAEGAAEGRTDFMLYITTSLFALGAGMFFLRFYPLLVKLIFRLGRKIWPAGIYAALNRVSRNKDCSYIMLFIILTLSTGIFSADAARTINSNIENNVKCLVGADVCYKPVWTKYDENGKLIAGETDSTGSTVALTDEDGNVIQTIKVTYKEMFTDQFSSIKEIDSMCRLFKSANQVKVRSGSTIKADVDLVGIDPYEFASTAWNVSYLNDYHLNEYINIMTNFPEGVLLSRDVMEYLGVNTGDTVRIFTDIGTVEAVVITCIDRWPTHYPTRESAGGLTVPSSLVVCNLNYYFTQNEIRPYSFLINKAEGVSDVELYNALKNSQFGIAEFESASANLAKEKNDPILQGTNGMLSVSFLVSLVICATGFMIYWIISIKNRTLQFGISRALGMSKFGVMLTLIVEQLLVSGVAVVMGVIIGELGSRMFVPVLAMNYQQVAVAVPFRVIASRTDFIRVATIMAVMLVACFAVLSTMAIKLKIDRAVKLGEE